MLLVLTCRSRERAGTPGKTGEKKNMASKMLTYACKHISVYIYIYTDRPGICMSGPRGEVHDHHPCSHSILVYLAIGSRVPYICTYNRLIHTHLYMYIHVFVFHKYIVVDRACASIYIYIDR